MSEVAESDERTIFLQPGERRSERLGLRFDPSIANPGNGDRTIRVEAHVSYRSLRFNRTEKSQHLATLIGPGKIDWWQSGGGEDRGSYYELGAFVTPYDRTVDWLASESLGLAKTIDEQEERIGDTNLSKVMTAVEILRATGCLYRSDPELRYYSEGGTQQEFDYVKYPVQTIYDMEGDCDDLVVLLASLLESQGVESTMMITSGHTFLLANTNINSKESLGNRFKAPGSFVEADGLICIPLDVTRIQGGFIECWKGGIANEVSSRSGSGAIPIPTKSAMDEYPAGEAVGIRKELVVRKGLDFPSISEYLREDLRYLQQQLQE